MKTNSALVDLADMATIDLVYLPSKWNSSWPVSAFFHQRLVKFSSCSGVNDCPALLTVILQARDISAEEGRKFTCATCAVTLITQLIVQHIRFYFNLERHIKRYNHHHHHHHHHRHRHPHRHHHHHHHHHRHQKHHRYYSVIVAIIIIIIIAVNFPT